MTSPPADHLTGSTDLLTYYNLVPCYKKYTNKTMDPTWRPFVADLPGKTSVDQPADNYLLHILRDPHIEENSGQRIQPLDLVTLKDAYHLKEGPVPGVSEFYSLSSPLFITLTLSITSSM